jgi:AraC-like DNA-binding protein
MLNNISVLRQDYLKKRLNNVELLNEKLHKVFVDDKNEDAYAHYSPIHLKMADYVNAIRVNDLQGMSRILHIKGEVYQLLSMHISGHDKFQTSAMLPPSLLNEELKTVRKLGELIIKDPALNYSLELLSFEAGLSQAKLQEGFKFLFARTVTEYIRHIRLKAARELMNTTDLSISQIVYSIGFTSRSYFSKIFKEKYGMTPHEFKKQILFPVNEVV